MKKGKLSLVCAGILSCTILFSSCIGSFALFNRMSDWNHSISDNKFVNELVFVALHIIPVYEIAYVADILVINSIEFWSGSNPVAKAGDVKQIKGENGDYLVETLENGYSITKEGEEAVELIYNEETSTWNVIAGEVSQELIKINSDGTAQLFVPGGESINVTLDAQGVLAAQQYASGAYFATR